MSQQTARDLVVATVAASPTPMTAAEIIRATNLNPGGVYVLLYALRNEGTLRRRARPNPGRGRDLVEYFVEPPKETLPSSKDFDDEVPDHVWWREQEARGFRRPGRSPKACNVQRA